MTEHKPVDTEGLALRVNALRTAQHAFQQKVPDAISTIRRISRSLTLSDESSHFPEVAALATTLSESGDQQMGPLLEKVIPRLRALAAGPYKKTHGVLIIEDNVVAAQLLQQHLEALHQTVTVSKTLAEAEKMLAHGHIALVLLDLQLPDGDGRDFILRMREQPATAAIPIFVMSSKEGSQVQTECFALGADAFFKKPFDPVTLSTAVAARLQRSMDPAHSSPLDPLTALPNRAAFTHAFMRAAMLASRSAQPLSVAILDVDRFKAVNDMYGHPTGDNVLRRLASVVSKSLRGSDFLARWGGEEFAVFFPNTDLPESCVALDKALKAFRRELFKAPDGRTFRVTFSAGVALAKAGIDVERAIAVADRYLYLAKASGRNLVLTEMDKVSLKKNILLVEDDAVTATVIKRFLKRDGFKVIHVKNGRAAAAAARGPIALVTLDIKMPGVGGFELLKRFRKIPALHHVPIIMLTSADKQEDILRAFELGADDYIVKPFSPREFLARIHRFIQKY